MEGENSYPNIIILFYMIEHFIWMNITSMPMIQHISNILGCSLDYFLTKCLVKVMAWPMEGVWQIGHGIFYELIWHSLMGRVFDDRPNCPMCLSLHFKVAMIL